MGKGQGDDLCLIQASSPWSLSKNSKCGLSVHQVTLCLEAIQCSIWATLPLQALRKAQWKQFPSSPLSECPSLCVARPAEWACTSPHQVCVQTDKLLILFIYQKFWMRIVISSFFYLSVFGSCFPFDSFRCGSVEHGLPGLGIVWSLMGFQHVKEILPHGFVPMMFFFASLVSLSLLRDPFLQWKAVQAPFKLQIAHTLLLLWKSPPLLWLIKVAVEKKGCCWDLAWSLKFFFFFLHYHFQQWSIMLTTILALDCLSADICRKRVT